MTVHVVALSGGKDSTAMALRLAELEPRDYMYICTPTGNELPEMFDHWRRLGEILGKPIIPIMTRSLVALIRKQGALPNWRQRWCTRMLKIEPFAHWLALQGEAICYVGLRADESEREGGDYAALPAVSMRFPLRDWGWGLGDVLAYLKARNVPIPKRTDCGLCFFQRLIEWWELWKNYPAAWAEGESLELTTGHTFRSPGRDTWPASMRGLRERFEAGDVPRDTRADKIAEMKCRVCRT
jgi:3'-phosphoadenosine 5'-phosphosulfate sulfotransferase (PAPS reductase)/FAD synthetase